MVWEGMKSVWSSISNWVEDKVNWLTDKLSFWKKSEAQMNTNNIKTDRNVGSYFTGLDYVPYNNYPALLHQGERVLTAEENKAFETQQSQSIENNFNIENLVVREEADIMKIAKELFNMKRRTRRGIGMA